MGRRRRKRERATRRRRRLRARWLVDGALLAAAVAILAQRGGPLRGAFDGWLRQRTLVERSSARWEELTGMPTGRPGVRTRPTVLVEFTDYRCPFCRRAQPALDSLDLAPVGPGPPAPAREASRPEAGGRGTPTGHRVVRVVRHLPIASLHRDAPLLARVSVCAEGDAAFAAVHRALYDTPPSATEGALTRLLTEAGVERPASVLRCARSSTAYERVRADLRLAAELRLRATPTFLAPGAAHEGTLSVARLREMLRLPPPTARERATRERPP